MNSDKVRRYAAFGKRCLIDKIRENSKIPERAWKFIRNPIFRLGQDSLPIVSRTGKFIRL